MNLQRLADLHDFASNVCDTMGVFAYMSLANVTPDRYVSSFGGWAGLPMLGIQSRAPHVAFSKMGELILFGAGNDSRLIMTPVPGYESGLGWMGAVAQNGLVVAVSKWAEEHDRLLALITLYHAQYEKLTLHHAGFRFEDYAKFTVENRLFSGGLVRNVPNDHERVYFPLGGGRYREHQWFPDGPHDPARHWDFVTAQPANFLWFIARAYGQEPVFFEDSGENDPIGVVWVTAKEDGSKLGVMARRKHWVVENG